MTSCGARAGRVCSLTTTARAAAGGGTMIESPPAATVAVAVGAPDDARARNGRPSGVSACREGRSASPPPCRPELPAT